MKDLNSTVMTSEMAIDDKCPLVKTENSEGKV